MRFVFQFIVLVFTMAQATQSLADCKECTKNYRLCVAQAKGIVSQVQACQLDEEETQENRLKASYAFALKRLTPERQKELKDVQIRWIAYRLATSRYYIDTGLSGYKILSSDRSLQLTTQRISELDKIDY